MIFYPEEKATDLDCTFYYVSTDHDFPFFVKEGGDLYLCYDKSLKFRSIEGSIQSITKLHEMKLMRFMDVDRIREFVEKTWPEDTRIYRDFENKGFGYFDLQSLIDSGDAQTINYDTYSTAATDVWPEFMLDTGEFIEDKLTRTNLNGFGLLPDHFKGVAEFSQILAQLQAHYLMNEAYLEADKILAEDRVLEKFLMYLEYSRDLNNNYTSLKGFDCLKDELILNDNSPGIRDTLDAIESKVLASGNKAHIRQLTEDGFGAKGNKRIVHLKFNVAKIYDSMSFKDDVLNLIKKTSDCFIGINVNFVEYMDETPKIRLSPEVKLVDILSETEAIISFTLHVCLPKGF